jgi:hypothetical protein
LREICEALLFGLFELRFEEGVHVLEDDDVEFVLGVLSVCFEITVVLFMKDLREPEEQVIKCIMFLVDVGTVRGAHRMVVAHYALVGQFCVTGGVRVIENYRSLALSLEVEPDFTEVVLVLRLQLLVSVEVLVVAVVETL